MSSDLDQKVELLARKMISNRWGADAWERGLGGMSGEDEVEKWRDSWRFEARGLLELLVDNGYNIVYGEVSGRYSIYRYGDYELGSKAEATELKELNGRRVEEQIVTTIRSPWTEF